MTYKIKIMFYKLMFLQVKTDPAMWKVYTIS